MLDDLQDQLVHVIGSGKPLFVLGDTNFDMLKVTGSDVQKYRQVLEDLNLKQIVVDQTRPASGALLDHVIVRSTDSVTSARVQSCAWSDHDLVIAETPVRRERRIPVEVTIRSTRNLVPDALRLELLLADWTAVHGADGVEDRWAAWRATWSPTLDKHMPLKKVRPKKQPCPWLTDNSELRGMMRERDLARAECNVDPCAESRQSYVVKRNAVKSAQCRARSDFFLSSFKYSRRTTWKDVRRFLISSKGTTGATAPSERTVEWADRLNNHFATVGQRVSAELEAERSSAQPLSPCPPRVVSGAFRVHPVTLPELHNALKRMSSSKASGDDGITVSMLRLTFPVIAPHLLKVINTSITSGVLPREWKIATVIPIFKSGSQTEPGNYRPVSILPTVAKLAESVVCSQLVRYLVSHNVLCDQQHGFRPGRSTESAMLDAVTHLTSNMDRGMVSCLTTADTSKAFDSVQHGRLLDKIGWYGVDEHWFRDWLSDRHQRVRGGSTTVPITHGVVQGSILGPVLYLLFTNDLTSFLSDTKTVLYADDVQFIHCGLPNQQGEMQRDIELTLSKAQRWFVENTLKINPTKSDLVLISSRQRQFKHKFEVRFGNATLHPSSNAKILGFTLDSNLSFEKHVSTMTQRCYATLSGLSKFTYRLPEEVKKFLIESLVFPHILYCATVWAGCNATQRKRIQKIIYHSARIVKCCRRQERMTPVLCALKWPKVDELVAERDLVMVHNTYIDCCVVTIHQPV